jgi:hypothetical protein
MDAALRWLIAFLCTLLIELPIYALWLRGHGRRPWHPLAPGLAANLLTHPIFGAWVLWTLPSGRAIALAEAAIVLVEAVVLRGQPWCPVRWRRALLSAATANLASYLVGLLLARVLPLL